MTPEFHAAQRICRQHAKSFYFASFFLPRPKRNAAYAVYAFCRLLDDAVDENPGNEEIGIRQFTEILQRVYDNQSVELPDPQQTLAIKAFAQTAKQYAIPQRYFLDLTEGCRMDLTVHRYETWADLERYCYHVAGVVGLTMSCIFGLTDEAAKKNAVQMGNAMQLTNILRDVKEDFQRGRVYLPQEELREFQYSEADLRGERINSAWINLMKFQIQRARNLYQSGAQGLQSLSNDGSRFCAAAMAAIYGGILDAIERQRYDVYSQRARLTTLQKLARLPTAWRMCKGNGMFVRG